MLNTTQKLYCPSVHTPLTYNGGSRKNIWGAWSLIIWEVKRNYYRTN